jgi:class 3 adenylate cyclase/predicted ATPase
MMALTTPRLTSERQVDIAAWLTGLGLERYKQAFLENEIDTAVLPKLTADDLTEMGVVIVGHRRKLLEAIADLKSAPPSAPESHTPELADPSRQLDAERRHLTVMFIDLVGSTALSTQIDPEDMGKVIRAFQNIVAGEITRFGGHVARFMGDGALAYFGWPRAHEDEAEQAVRAGLAIVATLAKPTGGGKPMTCRVGIATGLVVVGELVGEGAAQEETVVGETPNLAARLLGAAEPGMVIIVEATRRLLGKVFEIIDLGPHTLKGIAAPVPTFAVRGERSSDSRFAARCGDRLLPMVGREQELALLIERWRQARSREGQLVLLVGEAGIGKSRITNALIDAVAADDYVRIHYQCSPYHADSALYPTIQQLTRAAGDRAGDTTETKLDKLERLLAQAGADTGEAAPLIAALLGLAGEGRYGALRLTPQQQRARTLDALIRQLVGLAQRRPVLWVVEDAHWIDPTTQELIELALDRVARSRVLVLLTARPTFEHGFGGHPIMTLLTLNRLGREQVERIVDRITGGKTLPAALLHEIARRTDGVPLFVEEMTKAVLESGLLRETEASWVLDGPLREQTVPTSLQDSLMARLDHLQPVKQVAQTAAVIGREFDHALLVAIAPLPGPALEAALEGLVGAELVFRRGTPPDATYLFKHALVRDAAYESLLKRRRVELHGEIARALEERFPQIARDQPELLAHHLTEAGKPDAAVPYWQRAGERAARASANAEATAHFRQAIALVEGLPISNERDHLELRLQTQLAGCLFATEGYGAAATVAAVVRAYELSDRVSDPALLFPVLYGQWVYNIVWAQHPLALEIADRFLQLSKGQADTGPALIGHRMLGTSFFNLGRTTEAVAELEQALALYQPDRHAGLAYQYGQDQRASGLTVLAQAQWQLGFPDHARAAVDEAIAHGRRSSHANSLAYALYWGGIVLEYFLGDLDMVEQHARELADLFDRHGMAMWQAYAHVAVGWRRARAGEAVTSITMIEKGLTGLEATGTVYWRPFQLLLLADAHVAHGAIDNALAVLDEALAVSVRQKELWLEPELHRRRGGVLLNRTARVAEAQACLETACAIASLRQARSWELRAACDLARLLAEQGKRGEAHNLVAGVYGCFTEGFDTPDLKVAKALMEKLR